MFRTRVPRPTKPRRKFSSQSATDSDADPAIQHDFSRRSSPEGSRPQKALQKSKNPDETKKKHTLKSEILRQVATVAYLDNLEDCHRTMGSFSGEDGFMKGCLDLSWSRNAGGGAKSGFSSGFWIFGAPFGVGTPLGSSVSRNRAGWRDRRPNR